MTNKFAAAAAAVAAHTNMTEAQKGGDYTPPAAGPCRLRLVGYVETGKHDSTYQGVTKEKPEARFFFEVSGPKHPAREHEGKKYPAAVIEVKLDISRNEKAKFFKLFQLLNYKGTATHPAQLLGEPFKGTILHREWSSPSGAKGVALELWDKATASWKIEPPRRLDEDTGEFHPIEVAAALTPLKCFLWDNPDMEQWASIFIDGEYAAEEAKDGKAARPAKSKNVVQNRIKQAKNYSGSPIDILLGTGGKGLDLDVGNDEESEGSEATTSSTTSRSNVDPLAGVGV
jgi:hypothetical protein